MRRRRAERCLVRADVAFYAGFLDDARAATDEARELDAGLPAIEEMERRIAGASAEPELWLQTAPVESAGTADSEEKGRPLYYPLAVALACASVALVAAASFGWRAVPQRNAPATLEAALRGDVTLPAEPALDTQFEVPEPAAPVSDPAESEAAEPVPEAAEPTATSTSGLADPAPAAALSRRDVGRAVTPEDRNRPERPGIEALRGTRPPASTVAAPPPPIDAEPRTTPEEPLASFKPSAVEAVPLSVAALAPPPSVPVSVPEPADPVRPRPAAVAPGVDPQAAVRATLARYEAAYSGLNVSAARAVWPAVDARALARAFDGLSSQRVALEQCDVRVNGGAAQATCSGRAEWTPKVGGGERRQNRRWAFELTNAGGTWQIVRADAR